ncbi:MAG: OmpA family protein [Psychrobium sp.]|nr:OmpA family protein [Psychrobium sp.]
MRNTTILASLLYLTSANSLANESVNLPYDCELREQKKQIYCAKPGWYLHGGVGVVNGSSTIADFRDPLAAQGYNITDVVINEQRLGFKMNLGYSFTPNLAIEGGYSDLGNVDVAMSTVVSNPSAFFSAVDNLHPTSARGLTISGVATLALTPSFTLNGRIGLFKWQGDFNTVNVYTAEHVGEHDTKGTDFYYGAYAEYLLSKQTRLTLEWERYHFDKNDSDMLSLGLKYYFGNTRVLQATPVVLPIEPIKQPKQIIVAAPQELRLIVPFANDKSIISADYIAQLDAIGKKIEGHTVKLFTITGHTSTSGSRRYNQALSQRRVNVTANYFINQLAIKPSVIKAQAFGEDKLRDHSGTATAADVNRRIELYIKYQ